MRLRNYFGFVYTSNFDGGGGHKKCELHENSFLRTFERVKDHTRKHANISPLPITGEASMSGFLEVKPSSGLNITWRL